MAALASAGPATKARNSRPSPCLRVMKLPFCAGEFLSSPTAATLRVNTTSESTKTLRNFIELLQQRIVEFPSLFASAPAQQLSKSKAIGPTTSNRCARCTENLLILAAQCISFALGVFRYYCTVTMTVVV